MYIFEESLNGRNKKEKYRAKDLSKRLLFVDERKHKYVKKVVVIGIFRSSAKWTI